MIKNLRGENHKDFTIKQEKLWRCIFYLSSK